MPNHIPVGHDDGAAILHGLELLRGESAKQAAILATQAGTTVPSTLLNDWPAVRAAIRDGYASGIMPVGTQFVAGFEDSHASTTTDYDAPWDIAHYADATIDGGDTIPVMYAQMHYCLPFDTQFSNYQAFLYAIDSLPAGTYNVTMGVSWGTNVVSGRTYQFTLTQALPAKGQLTGFYGAPDQSPSNWKVYAWASQTATSATETVDVTEGSGGVSLGTFTFAGAQQVPASGTPEANSTVTVDGATVRYYGLNALRRVAYGNNRWLHSPLRQWLNAQGTGWYVPQTVFDRPPAYVSYPGFLSMLPAELVNSMRRVAQVTATNYETDGGTSSEPLSDVTYDRVFLPSWEQHYLRVDSSYGGTAGLEGEAWDYWKAVNGTSTPPAAGTTNREYIQFDLAGSHAARTCWMRSAGRYGGHTVAFVYSSGYCSLHTAISGLRVAPACAIG